jgi:mannose-1-phosphate guanylyltransferase
MGAMRAMVFCAGLGTRLRPLTDQLPKPACPILDRPLCWYDLALLAGAGVSEVVVNTHQLPEQMAQAARAGAARLGLSLEISHEPELLDTGGGLKRAAQWLGRETFLLLNGDILFDVDLPGALAAHRRAGAAATMVVKRMPTGAPYRPVHVDERGLVIRIAGDAPAPPGTEPWLFTGVHVLEPEIFARLPEGRSGLHEDGYGPWLRAGAKILAHPDEGAWSDIGTPARYLEANLGLLAGTFPARRFAALGAVTAGRCGSHLGESARVDGEAIDSVVGSGAIIPSGARVHRSVVWAGTRLRDGEQLDGVIAAGDVRVVPSAAP